jgi:hypothetical protein
MHVDTILETCHLHHVVLVLLPDVVENEVVAEGGEGDGGHCQRQFSTAQGSRFLPVDPQDDGGEKSSLGDPGRVL